MSYIQQITENNNLNWSNFYGKIEEIIGELSDTVKNNLLSEKAKGKIFEFFKSYFLANKSLNPKESQELYNVIKEIVTEDTVLNAENLSILSDLLFTLQHLSFKKIIEEASLPQKLIQSAIKERSLATTEKAEDFIKQFFGYFTGYLERSNPKNSEDLKAKWDSLIILMFRWSIWKPTNPSFMLLTSLSFFRNLRNQFKHCANVIDDQVLLLAKQTLQQVKQIENPGKYLGFLEENIKEMVGCRYVYYLPSNEQSLFQNHSIVLRPSNVFPTRITINLNTINISINYDALTENKVGMLKEAIHNLYASVIQHTGEAIERKAIELFVFNNQTHFDRYGSLVWYLDTSKGSDTHYVEGRNSLTTVASFVYQEAGGFKNLQYELTRAFMLRIVGPDYGKFLPAVFTEGLPYFFEHGKDKLSVLKEIKGLENGKLKDTCEIMKLEEGDPLAPLYGYFWIRYLDEKKEGTVRNILEAAKNRDPQRVKLISTCEEEKVDFSHWIEQEIGPCNNSVSGLFDAVKKQDTHCMKQIHVGPELINSKEIGTGNTPLHIAFEQWAKAYSQSDNAKEENARSIIWYLLLEGADLKIRNEEGKAPLDFVTNSDFIDYFRKMAENAERSRSEYSTTPKVTDSASPRTGIGMETTHTTIPVPTLETTQRPLLSTETASESTQNPHQDNTVTRTAISTQVLYRPTLAYRMGIGTATGVAQGLSTAFFDLSKERYPFWANKKVTTLKNRAFSAGQIVTSSLIHSAQAYSLSYPTRLGINPEGEAAFWWSMGAYGLMGFGAEVGINALQSWLLSRFLNRFPHLFAHGLRILLPFAFLLCSDWQDEQELLDKTLSLMCQMAAHLVGYHALYWGWNKYAPLTDKTETVEAGIPLLNKGVQDLDENWQFVFLVEQLEARLQRFKGLTRYKELFGNAIEYVKHVISRNKSLASLKNVLTKSGLKVKLNDIEQRLNPENRISKRQLLDCLNDENELECTRLICRALQFRLEHITHLQITRIEQSVCHKIKSLFEGVQAIRDQLESRKGSLGELKSAFSAVEKQAYRVCWLHYEYDPTQKSTVLNCLEVVKKELEGFKQLLYDSTVGRKLCVSEAILSERIERLTQAIDNAFNYEDRVASSNRGSMPGENENLDLPHPPSWLLNDDYGTLPPSRKTVFVGRVGQFWNEAHLYEEINYAATTQCPSPNSPRFDIP